MQRGYTTRSKRKERKYDENFEQHWFTSIQWKYPVSTTTVDYKQDPANPDLTITHRKNLCKGLDGYFLRLKGYI